MSESRNCDACGNPNLLTSKFCVYCGKPMSQIDESSIDSSEEVDVAVSESHSYVAHAGTGNSDDSKPNRSDSKFWKGMRARINRERFESIFVANWLEILGTIALTIGVFFLGQLFIEKEIEIWLFITGIILGNLVIVLSESGNKFNVISKSTSKWVTFAGASLALISVLFFSVRNEDDTDLIAAATAIYSILLLILAMARKIEPLALISFAGSIAVQVLGFQSITDGHTTQGTQGIFRESFDQTELLVLSNLLMLSVTAYVSVTRRWISFKSVIITGGFVSWMWVFDDRGLGTDLEQILIFAVVSTILTVSVLGQTAINRTKSNLSDTLPAAFFTIFFSIGVWVIFDGSTTGNVFLVAGITYLSLAYYYSSRRDDTTFTSILTGSGILFVLSGIFGYAFDTRYLTLTLSIFATSLFIGSAKTSNSDLKNTGLILSIVSTILLVTWDPHEDPVLSLITYALVIGSLFSNYLFYTKSKSTLTTRFVIVSDWFESQRIDTGKIGRGRDLLYRYSNYDGTQMTLLLMSNFAVFFALALGASIGIEEFDFFDNRNQWKSLSITTLWGAYATGMVITGIHISSRFIRLGGLVVIGITVFKLFLYDSSDLGEELRVIAYLSLGLLLISTGLVYRKNANRFKQSSSNEQDLNSV